MESPIAHIFEQMWPEWVLAWPLFGDVPSHRFLIDIQGSFFNSFVSRRNFQVNTHFWDLGVKRSQNTLFPIRLWLVENMQTDIEWHQRLSNIFFLYPFLSFEPFWGHRGSEPTYKDLLFWQWKYFKQYLADS